MDRCSAEITFEFNLVEFFFTHQCHFIERNGCLALPVKPSSTEITPYPLFRIVAVLYAANCTFFTIDAGVTVGFIPCWFFGLTARDAGHYTNRFLLWMLFFQFFFFSFRFTLSLSPCLCCFFVVFFLLFFFKISYVLKTRDSFREVCFWFGSDGFGFAPLKDGSFKKIPQIGNVILEDDVEVGANTVIDRATMGSTVIRKGVKLDNLIQIAHNVEIGKNTVMAAQSGVAGSTKLGSSCQVGGQAGLVGHISVGDRTLIQAKSGMTKSVIEEGTKWYGYPAIDYNNYLKSFAIYKNLPDLQSRLDKLEKLFEDLRDRSE